MMQALISAATYSLSRVLNAQRADLLMSNMTDRTGGYAWSLAESQRSEVTGEAHMSGVDKHTANNS